MRADLLSTTLSVAAPVQFDLPAELVSGLFGGSVVGALGFVMLKGILAQLKSYNELVVSYQNRESGILSENAQLSRMNEDFSTILHENSVHLEACRKENEISIRRLETLAVEILDLKSKIVRLERQIHNKEKLD